MVRIVQYRQKCIGCNACIEAAFNRWRISTKDGKCTLVRGTQKKGIYMAIVGDDEYQSNKTAQIICPVNIIKVEFVV